MLKDILIANNARLQSSQGINCKLQLFDQKFIPDNTMKAFTRFFNKTVIKWVILASLFYLLSILFFPNNQEGIKVQEVPNPQQAYGGWVTDMANILSDKTETRLNQIIADSEAKNGAEIAVVTVTKTSFYPSPKAFATELFN